MTATSSTHTAVLYVAGAIALVLLAPYAGCHFITTAPSTVEERLNFGNNGLRTKEKKPSERPQGQPSKPKSSQFSDLDDLLN